eukprot:gene2883-569_t
MSNSMAGTPPRGVIPLLGPSAGQLCGAAPELEQEKLRRSVERLHAWGSNQTQQRSSPSAPLCGNAKSQLGSPNDEVLREERNRQATWRDLEMGYAVREYNLINQYPLHHPTAWFRQKEQKYVALLKGLAEGFGLAHPDRDYADILGDLSLTPLPPLPAPGLLLTTFGAVNDCYAFAPTATHAAHAHAGAAFDGHPHVEWLSLHPPKALHPHHVANGAWFPLPPPLCRASVGGLVPVGQGHALVTGAPACSGLIVEAQLRASESLFLHLVTNIHSAEVHDLRSRLDAEQADQDRFLPFLGVAAFQARQAPAVLSQ